MSRSPRPRRMSLSSLATPLSPSPSLLPTSSRSARSATRISVSSLTVCTSPRRATLSRTSKCDINTYCDGLVFSRLFVSAGNQNTTGFWSGFLRQEWPGFNHLQAQHST
nr:uncharacterized protein CTRU02_06536 [Colletotrichum truncatum]KAF6792453.1 hypothetical protein CTRU02_06536 [Colletotrichum truncatum]